ncbi:dTMP kinase [Dethiosulfovibrio salsuginis]|uniref:Thymidylate kinase n=1 Tax=Dethiosulfovibrio salsuginis TaxID=561720 RepID=A0A1X7I9S9_9BACT|nr:dTMP kinase [Dethiosulfovibrio salsuginis]SMG10765.1 dTMP kinase [Dethiosulfovibrio salsuginis]
MLVSSRMHRKGLFISFEGIDGSGKSTQARLLCDHLRDLGYSVTLTREPGDWSEGGKLRDVLLNGVLMHHKTELFLFLADRCEHLVQVVIPALSRGDIVICDRYTDSTVAYQCFGRGLELGFVERIFGWCDFPIPDMTVWLNLSRQESLSRMEGRGTSDRIELDFDLMSKISEGFSELARRYPDRIVPVDGSGDPEEVFGRVCDSLKGLIR